MKNKAVLIILHMLPIFLLVFLLYKLYTYTPHTDTPLLVCFLALLAFTVSTILWLRIRKACPQSTVVWLVSTAVLLFVFYTGSKIPFCMECDRITPEELDFLRHWIKP